MRFWLRLAVVALLAGWFGVAPLQADAGITVSLNGDWRFLPDPAAALKVGDLASASNTRAIRVPSSWQSQFVDLRDYAGVAWYWRSLTLDPPAPDQVVLLRFGAVDYSAEVYFNGQKVGAHEGGYLPFDFDVTTLVRAGENQIAVRVVDPGAKPDEVEGIKYAEIPHGKQNWYVETSGLWQGVELDIRPRLRLGDVHIAARADGNFNILVPVITAERGAKAGPQIRADVEIRDAGQKSLWQESRGLPPGASAAEFSGKLLWPALWTPSNPGLYTLRASLSSGDSQTIRFGFRTLETRDGKFYLNGKVTYLRGALDQDFYPETVYTPPSFDYLRDEIRKAKALGLNLLRCHIKVPDPEYLRAADEEGILIWYEIPNWDKLNPDSERRALTTLHGMAQRDWNHPSIVIASLVNESWGTDLKGAADRQWLKQAYQEAKKFVPGWLIVDNSPCCDNFHLATDIADFHQYASIPDSAANFDRWVADQDTRPGWLFSPYGDATPRGDEPLVLSEFGNWGLPRLPEPRPWWFGRDFRGRSIALPEGVVKRFQEYRYTSLFPDVNALAEATEWHEYQSLKYEIESVRAHPEIQGYVITEFTDVNWESNGLLDMWRHPKVFGQRLSKLQQDDVVILRAERRNFSTLEKAKADIHFSHYAPILLTGALVSLEIEGGKDTWNLALPEVPLGSSKKVGSFEFGAPTVAAPSRVVLKVRVKAGGSIISENSLEFFFYPPKPLDLPPPVAFHDPAGRLRRLVTEMREHGYQAPSGKEAFPVLIASKFDDEVKRNLQAGGRVILIASDAQALAPGLEIATRRGDLSGNWISDFLWLRKDQEPFKRIGFDTLAGFETQAVTPAAVVVGVPPENFDDVLSGMFYGWINSNVGILVQAKGGKGKLIICTFSLGTAYGSDPYATYLLDALVNYVVTGFAPRLEIPL